MDAEQPAPTLFDDLLDRALRGDEIDVAKIFAEHPEISESERRQIRGLCGRSTTAGGPPPATAAPPAPPLPIDRIGGHKLQRRIGAGAMGAVFLADDEALGRQVAIKIVGPDILGSGERGDRFLREVRAAARLRHPNIVTVHSAGEQDGLRYMVMEHVQGRNLQEVLAEAAARGSRPTVAEVLRWGIEIARALGAAHQAGIAHRDVKPSNIRITDDGRAVLLDFGLARDVGDVTLTETGSFRGSPQYASPEQVESGDRPIDARTDLYSLGATLYELLTGVAPFRGETREQLFHAILTRDPLPPRRLDPTIPRDLETVVVAALDKDPARRPASAAALAEDLEAVRDGRPVSVRPLSVLGRAARWAKRRPAMAALAAVLAIAVPSMAGLIGFVIANLPKIEQAEAEASARALAELIEHAFVELGEGSRPDAARLFEQALASKPDSPEANAGLAMTRMLQHDAVGALAFLESLPEPLRDATWNGRLRVEALRWLERPADARALEATIPPPSTPADYFVTGFVQLERVHGGDLDAAPRAFEDLRAAVWLSPTAVALYQSELGHAAMHAGRHLEAKQIAAAIERLRPASAERWFAVGRTLRQADPAAAVRALEKAANPLPRFLAARDFIAIGLATIEPTDARRKLGADLARETARIDPNRAGPHFAVAVTSDALGDTEAALAALREAVRIDPSHFDAQSRLHRMCLERGDLEGAAAAARRVAAISPRRKQSWDRLGIVLTRIAQYEEAIAAFRKALRIAPDDPSLLCNLGTALLRSGDFDEALATMRKGHEIGSRQKDWRYPSATWVQDCERAIALEARLEEIRSKGPPPSQEERLLIAGRVCRPKQLFAEAARLYAVAFEIDPEIAAGMDPDYVLAAAGAAINAGVGKAADSPADGAERATLRAQALRLLSERLGELEDIVRDGSAHGGAAAMRVAVWMTEPELAPVGPKADRRDLPETESAAWRAFWERCAAIAPASRPASRSVSR